MAKLYVFHQGGHDNGQLWYNASSDGTTWDGDTQVPNTGMSEGPGAAVFTNSAANPSKLYCFHQGAYENGQLWYNVSPDGSSWAGDQQVLNTGISAGPSAVSFSPSASSNPLLYCFHQDSGGDGYLRYNTSADGSTWTSELSVPKTGMSAGPSAVAFTNNATNPAKLYCFHQGISNNGQLWYNVSSDGIHWEGDRQAPNTSMSASPGAVVFNSKLYCFHQGGGDSGQLWYNVSPDGAAWEGDRQVPNVGMSAGPSAVVFSYTDANQQVITNLYCFYQGSGNKGELWYSTSSDGVTWSAAQQVSSMSMSAGPSAVSF
jgi:hypothetical protein